MKTVRTEARLTRPSPATTGLPAHCWPHVRLEEPDKQQRRNVPSPPHYEQDEVIPLLTHDFAIPLQGGSSLLVPFTRLQNALARFLSTSAICIMNGTPAAYR